MTSPPLLASPVSVQLFARLFGFCYFSHATCITPKLLICWQTEFINCTGYARLAHASWSCGCLWCKPSPQSFKRTLTYLHQVWPPTLTTPTLVWLVLVSSSPVSHHYARLPGCCCCCCLAWSCCSWFGSVTFWKAFISQHGPRWRSHIEHQSISIPASSFFPRSPPSPAGAKRASNTAKFDSFERESDCHLRGKVAPLE